MSTRTCIKCRLHGQVAALKGHKRVCPYANCTCNKCASHDHVMAHKTKLRDEKNDKGRMWRRALSHTLSKPSSTATFPEMSVSKGSAQGQNAMLALQMANFEDAKAFVKKTKAEKRKGKCY